jgi:hypothetical protein
VIRIGALVDQTGTSTSLDFRKAVELAALQVNAALKHRGARVSFEIAFADTKSVPALARSEAIRLVNEQDVVGLLAAQSGETTQVNRLNYDPASPTQRQVPVTCFMCSSGFLNDPAAVDADPVTQAAYRDAANWLFRVFYNANYEAAVLTQVAAAGADRNGDGTLKIGILADAGHKSLALGIGAKLPELYQGAATTEIVYMTTIAELPGAWARVVDGYNETTGTADGIPDVVVMSVAPGSASEALKAYRASGHLLPILSNNSFRRDYILASLGTLANGLEGSSVMLVDDSSSGEAFVQAFTEYTGHRPELTASGAYDGTVTLMLASLVAAGDLHDPVTPTPAAVRAALEAINDPQGAVVRPTLEGFSRAAQQIRHGLPINYEGAYDSDDWNGVGDIFPPLVHWKVENGRFVEYETYRCDPQHPLCPVQ